MRLFGRCGRRFRPNWSLRQAESYVNDVTFVKSRLNDITTRPIPVHTLMKNTHNPRCFETLQLQPLQVRTSTVFFLLKGRLDVGPGLRAELLGRLQHSGVGVVPS